MLAWSSVTPQEKGHSLYDELPEPLKTVIATDPEEQKNKKQSKSNRAYPRQQRLCQSPPIYLPVFCTRK